MLVTISPEQLSLDPGSEVILHHQTWEDFETLLAIKQEKTFPKPHIPLLKAGAYIISMY